MGENNLYKHGSNFCLSCITYLTTVTYIFAYVITHNGNG